MASPAGTAETGVENVTGHRIGAATIDVLILAALFVGFALIFGEGRGSSPNGSRGFTLSLDRVGLLAYVAVCLLYFGAFEAVWKQTPGKMAVGLKVLSEDGTPASMGQVAGRTILRLVDWLPFLDLLGLAVVAASERHQRLGDMAARTLVVRIPEEPVSEADRRATRRSAGW